MPAPAAVPPLQNGDRLTRAEFERRYDAMPGLKKAELIEGIVYLPPPTGYESHGGPHFDVISWLGLYRSWTPGVEGGDNTSLRLILGENEPQPDAFLRIKPSHGGQSQTSRDGYVVGSPELIAEVAASSVSYDLHVKLQAYEKNNVREYVVWRVFDQAIDWFILRNRKYRRLARGRSGIYKSEVFPGLWLDPEAMIHGNLARVRDVLQQGLNSRQHAAFVARLQKAAARGRP
jgi:Uma2 family endonuclease